MIAQYDENGKILWGNTKSPMYMKSQKVHEDTFWGLMN